MERYRSYGERNMFNVEHQIGQWRTALLQQEIIRSEDVDLSLIHI